MTCKEIITKMDTKVQLRAPLPEDGVAVNKLVERCTPLDPNSLYCNLLQCSHFASTSVAAFLKGELVGFISGYCVPERTNTLFIWQVAVDESARGSGLAGKMIASLLERNACKAIEFIETTITEENQASWGLFEGVARRLNAELKRSLMFDKAAHLNNEHASELLVKIGPFSGSLPTRK